MKYRLILIVFSIFFLIISCKNQSPDDSFQCYEYWTKLNAKWEIAYEDVKYCSDEMILRSKDSIWAIIFPGTLTLKNDTIYANQEAGFPNTCFKIGYVRVGDNKYIDIFKHKEKFAVINDSIIEYSGKKFIKTRKTIFNGCWCEWK